MRAAVAASPWFVALVGVVARALGMLVGIFSIRIVSDGVGEVGYAGYVVLVGIQPWFMLLDLGLAPAIQNQFARGERNRYRRPLYAVLVLSACVLAFWSSLAEPLRALLISEAGTAFDVAVGGSIGVVLGVGAIVHRAWFGEHRGWMSHLVQILSSLFALCLLVAVRPETISVALLCVFAPHCFMVLLAVLRLAGGRGDRDAAWVAGVEQRDFWLMAWMTTLTTYADYLVLALLSSGGEVVAYFLAMKFFAIIYLPVTLLTQAFGPRFTSMAKAGGNGVMRLVMRMIAVALLAVGVGSAAFVPLSDLACGLVAPEVSTYPSTGLLLVMVAYWCARAWCDGFAQVVWSLAGVHRYFVVLPIQAALGIGGMLVLVPRFGGLGVAIAQTGALVVTMLWYSPLAAHRSLRECVVVS
jgi:O-antigen/teichoic acid export membrane protein